MQLHTYNRVLYIIALSFLIQGTSFGGGFQINMLGTKATSMGGAFTGFAKDASAVYYNPGAMTFSEYTQLSLGTSLIFTSSSYLSPYTGNSNMQDGFSAPLHIYGFTKLNEKTAVGLSVNTPFNLHTTWEDDWTGRYVSRETQYRAVFVQPSISYQFTENFGVGGGPIIAFGKTYLTRAMPYASQQGETGMELDGNSIGLGFNIGLFLKASDDLSLGLDFRSGVKMNVKEGDANFSNVPLSLSDQIPSSTKFDTEYSLPSVISLGAAYKLTRELTLCMDVNYTMWKSFDTLEFKFNEHSNLNFGAGKYYKNVFAVRLGAQYEISDHVDVRCGLAVDGSPVKDKYLSPENPDNDRLIASLGGTYKFTEKFSVDVAYMLQNIKEREVNNEEFNFGGNYKSLINIVGITLNYQF